MADKGRSDRETVLYVIKSIEDYIYIISEELALMKEDAEKLESDWCDGSFEEYKSKLASVSDALEGKLEVLENARKNLKKALESY